MADKLTTPIALALLAVYAMPVMAGSGASCNLNSVSGVNFGQYNPLTSAPDDSVGSVTVTCSANGHHDASFSIAIGSITARAYDPPRALQSSGAYQLRYQLYIDAARTTPWGDGTNGSMKRYGSFRSPRRGKSRTYYIYGRIFGGQLVAAGSYADTLGILVNF